MSDVRYGPGDPQIPYPTLDELLRSAREHVPGIHFPDVYEQGSSVVVRAEGDRLVIELVDHDGDVRARGSASAVDLAVDLDNGDLSLRQDDPAGMNMVLRAVRP